LLERRDDISIIAPGSGRKILSATKDNRRTALDWNLPEFAGPQKGDPLAIRREEGRCRILSTGNRREPALVQPPAREEELAICWVEYL
jgi:hypothetical protein